MLAVAERSPGLEPSIPHPEYHSLSRSLCQDAYTEVGEGPILRWFSLSRCLYSSDLSKKAQQKAQPYKTKFARRGHFLVVQVGFEGCPKGSVLWTKREVQRGLRMGAMGPRGCHHQEGKVAGAGTRL